MLRDIAFHTSFVAREEERKARTCDRAKQGACKAIVSARHRSTGTDRELLLQITDGPLKVTSVWAIWACCLACPACLSDLHLTAPAKYIQ